MNIKKVEKNKEFITSTLSTNNIKIKEEKDYGQKKLAYPINEKPRGHYYLFTIETNNNDFSELEHSFKLHKGILRYLLLNR